MATTALTTKANAFASGHFTKYSPALAGKLIKYMAEGRGITESALFIGISPMTLWEWTNPNSQYYKPDMEQALQLGRALSETWWLEQGRRNLRTKVPFNHVLWYMNMRNRWGWRDQVDLTSDGQPIAFSNTVPRPVIEA